jgi:hypothetical protein
MPYIATNYTKNPKAPLGKWVCDPKSALGPFDKVPTKDTENPDYCGQCVSYVKHVCPSLPRTAEWKKGVAAKGNKNIKDGTIIATFDANGKYSGHAAVYVSQTDKHLNVYDQFKTPPTPSPIAARELKFGAPVNSNNGDLFYVVEPLAR